MTIDLSSLEMYKVLQTKKVAFFHHANTVATSKSFIRQDALLSRQKMHDLDFEQTAQESDNKDIKFGIYDFVFLDGLDLAAYFDRPNVYGPVLFKFSIDILLRPDLPTVRVTKKNPTYWTGTTEIQDRYCTSVEEFSKIYLSGNKYLDGNMCFMLTSCGGILPFSYGLSEILIDNPERKQKGQDVMEIIKDHLFEDIDNFRRKYPGVRLLKTSRFQHYYKNLTLKEYLKKYKRTFRP